MHVEEEPALVPFGERVADAPRFVTFAVRAFVQVALLLLEVQRRRGRCSWGSPRSGLQRRRSSR